MELKESEIREKYVNVLTSKKVDEILDKQNKGFKLTLSEKIWFKGQPGVRRAGLQFAMTKHELDEYSKCKMNIHYFAEKYCKIKREDGTIGPMTLRGYQKDIIDLFTNNNYSILMASRQTGKAQDLDSVVWGENGKMKFGDLKIGDRIYDDKGELTNVIGIYPQGVKDIYEIEFSDGLKVRSCDEHLWEISKYSSNKKNTVQLSEIRNKYLSKRGDSIYYVKVAEPVNYPEKILPLDPYFLGLIIGDGSTRNNRLTISTKDDEIIDYLYNTIDDEIGVVKIEDKINKKVYDYRITKKNSKHKIISILKELDLMEKYSFEKHIPNIYLYGNINQRLSLLQGLMDTNGGISKNQPYFSTSSEILSENFRELCHSLGIRTNIRIKYPTYTYKNIKKRGKKSYIIRLLLKNDYKYPIFRLKRKQSQIKNKRFDWGQKRGIVNIKYIGKKEAQCISVDNNSSLYLTDNYIPTHNTVSAAITILHFSLFNKDKGTMIVANKGATVVEIVDKIKGIYKLLPFFLKKGIVNWNQSSIVFDNGCRIKTDKRTKEPAIGFTIDFLYIDEFAHIPNNIIEHYYTAVVPIISSVDNPRFVITSTPKGINLFHKMLVGAELSEDDPNWNGFRAMRVYWWQMKGRRDVKIFINEASLRKYNITKKDLMTFLLEKGYDVYEKEENKRKGIFIKYDSSNDETDIDFIRNLRYETLPLSELGVITNWSEQQMKIIGGEDNFKQEYDLHFLIGGKMLFDSVTIEKLNENIKTFEYKDIPEFNKMLKYPYNGLKFIKDIELFNINDAKKYQILISVDLSEGLGNDYSVLNIFRLLPKTEEEIKYYKKKLTDTQDFFKVEQIGMFKSNIYSVKEVAHILYLIAFVLFDDTNVKIVLERNTYGDELLAHIPHVFDEQNEYSNHVFVRFKHRVEDNSTKMGIKINKNKKLLVKEFQSNTKKGNIIIHEQNTFNEISTFTKHETPSGDITYKAESGHDDCIMTTIVLSSVFSNVAYKDMIDLLVNSLGGNISNIINPDLLSQYENEKPDLSTIGGAYKKIYGKGLLNKPEQLTPYGNMGGFRKPSFKKPNFPSRSPFDR